MSQDSKSGKKPRRPSKGTQSPSLPASGSTLPTDLKTVREKEAREFFINRELTAVGWNLADRSLVSTEIPIQGYDPTPWKGITDYCLFLPSGDILAVVEAKRCSRSPRDGEEQLRQYVRQIATQQSFPPFGFMTNGQQTWFWDVGAANPRLVARFFSPDDLKRLLFIRQNGKPLASESVSNSIVNRPYQHEAIRRVSEAFAKGKRRALLVMATGTGKTRTTMALIDIFFRAKQAQKVLFLADRDALVEQAMTDGFKSFLPNEPRDRIVTANISKDKRLYVATLQTMSRCFERFSPAFFDLIVFDEAHRSIFNRFNEVIEWFDARMVGLTATPAAFIERDTFRTFHCQDQIPTFLYPFNDAVDAKYLVDFTVFQAQTSFQRDGIKGATLDEEDRNALLAQGIDPDALDYAGTDIEVVVSNKDTLRRQWQEIMDRCIKDKSGQVPGKTIVFAMTREHAERIRDVFEEMYPQHVGMLQVIHHGMERVHDGPYGRGLISKFKHENKPRIAVSVDMLDTGVDIPEVVNLVFMKPVHSLIKLWQMIGRGTRNNEACRYPDRLPADGKERFLILDFWQNDFGKHHEELPPGELPILVALCNTRLKILEATMADPRSATYRQALTDVRWMVARIPTESFPIRKVWPEVEQGWTDGFWTALSAEKLAFLRLKVAPLLRFVSAVDLAAEVFTHKMERLRIQILRRDVSPSLLASIAEDVSRLPDYVHQDPAKTASTKLALSLHLASATPEQITGIIRDLPGEMRNRRDRPSTLVKLDLQDFVATRGMILLGPTGTPVYVEEYRRRVEERIQKLAESHPALVAIREGRQPSEDQLVDLERKLHRNLSHHDIQLSPETIRKVYGLRVDGHTGFLALLRHVLALDGIPDYATVVERRFADHITSHNYSGDQIRFLRCVQEIFLQKQGLDEADLYDEPKLTHFGRNAVTRFFQPREIKEIIELTKTLVA